MTDEATHKIESDRAKLNQEAKALQKFYQSFGAPLNRRDALEMARENRTKTAMEAALEKAKPTFLKDGHGLRGPQAPVRNREIVGVDGKGDDMQVSSKIKAGTTATEEATEVIASNVEGEPGMVTISPGPFTLL